MLEEKATELAYLSGDAEAVLAPATGARQRWQPLEEALTAISVGTAVLSYSALAGIMIANYQVPRWDLMAGPVILGCGAVFGLLYHGPCRLKAASLVAAMFLASAAVNWSSTLAEPQTLYSYVCLAAGVLLGPWPATFVAAAASAALFWLARSPSQIAGIPWHLLFLWLTVAVIWAVMGRIFTVLKRLEESESRAWHYAKVASERRGELVRAKKALADMYELLQRTNHQLAVARAEVEKAYRAKAQFAANVSHELRTPLNLILGFSEMMYHSPEVYGDMRWPPELRADIYEIYQATRHLLGMIDDILDLSRIEAQRLPLKLELVAISDVIQEAVTTVSGLLRGHGATLDVDVEAGLPELLIDRTRIRQVLLNLLQNAIRVTGPGQVKVSAQALGGEVVVSVTDTGPGIPPDELVSIFEEFRQSRSSVGGSGLGLAICRQLIHLHGGHIEAESAVGRGSVFRFYLPVPGSGRARSRLVYYSPEQWSPPVPENPLGKSVVVLASDRARAAELARCIRGYRAILADTCQGLAELVSTEHPAGIVLVSTPLSPPPTPPEGALHAAGRLDLPVIICEIPSEDVETAVCCKLGAACYLRKPVGHEELAKAINSSHPSPRRFLVVDDDPGFVTLAERMLRHSFGDIHVSKAYSGEEALERISKEAFDVVLLDLAMPGLSGLDVLAHMSKGGQNAAVPVVIAVSGHDFSGNLLGRCATSLALYRADGYSEAKLGDYISALLDSVPPDYSTAAPVSEQARAGA